jgi:hypothetical protein
VLPQEPRGIIEEQLTRLTASGSTALGVGGPDRPIGRRVAPMSPTLSASDLRPVSLVARLDTRALPELGIMKGVPSRSGARQTRAIDADSTT